MIIKEINEEELTNMNNKNILKWTIVTSALLLILSPVLTFACAYISGMIINFFVGAGLIKGLNLIFNTTRFTRDMIPLTCATLATIGRYFKTAVTTKNND